VTTYPAHGIHLRQPHRSRWLVLGVVVLAALVGAGVWAFVDHRSSNSKRITDTQAITFIRTGEGLPGLNAMHGGTVHSIALPAMERPYAIGMYRNGPYGEKVLNLLYAAGAAATRFQPSADRQAMLAMGRSTLTSMLAEGANTTHPEWIEQYGVTVQEAAAALVRGMFAGAR
jgi:hypothetical protein